MMNKEQKKNYISEMETQFQNNEAVLVTHYQGLTMSQLDDLRSQMREHGIKFTITKNRITKIAILVILFLVIVNLIPCSLI